MSKIPAGMKQEDFETGVLFFYGELSEADAAAFKARLDTDAALAAAYRELESFLGAIPKEEPAMPGAADWEKIGGHFRREESVIRNEKAKARKTARFRMVWAFAVYAVILGIGINWFIALSGKPTDLVIQAYAPKAIVPGSESAIRLIARHRTGVKMSQERMKEYQTEVDRLFESGETAEQDAAARETKDESAAAPEAEPSPAKTLAGADAAREKTLAGENEAKATEDAAQESAAPAPPADIEPEVFPSVEWNPILEPLAEKFKLEQAGLIPNVPVRIVLSSSTGRDVLWKGKTNEKGTLDETFRVPERIGENPVLEIQAQYKGAWQTIALPVNAERNLKIVLGTDKQRYQPGQTIHMRALLTDKTAFKNAAGESVVFSVETPDGTKIFRDAKETSEWGIAHTDFALADLVKLGDYTIKAAAGSREESVTVKVDKYVLPQIKIDFQTDKDWYLPGESITGTVAANYYFGNPVTAGKVSIKFSHFDYEEFVHGTSEGALSADGKYSFDFTASPLLFQRDPYSHQADITAEVTVTDGAGQTSKVTRQVSISLHPYIARMMPESGAWRGGVDNYVYLALSTVDRKPWNPKSVYFESPTGFNNLIKIAPGLYSGVIRAGDSGSTSRISAVDADGSEYSFFFPNFDYNVRTPILLHTDKAIYEPGETIKVKVLLPTSVPAVFLDVISGNQIVQSKAAGNISGIVDFELTALPAMSGESEIRVYAPTHSPDEADIILRDRRTVFVKSSGKSFGIEIIPAKPEYGPGDDAEVTLKLTDAGGKPAAGAVGLAAIDSKLFGVEDAKQGLESVYFNLLVDLLNPRIEIHGSELSTLMAGLPGADALLSENEKDISEDKAEESLVHLNYAYQAVGRAVAARKAILETPWYDIEKTSALSELERHLKQAETAKRRVEFGLPWLIIALTVLIFLFALVQHAFFFPAQPSKPLWLAYGKWTIASLVPLYLFVPAALSSGFWPPVIASAAGIALSAMAGKIIGEQINLYRLKAMILIAVYATSGAWIALAKMDIIGFLPDLSSNGFFIACLLALFPFLISHLFASNNIEHPYTGRVTRTSTFAYRVIGSAVIVTFIVALVQPNFMFVRAGSDGASESFATGAAVPPESMQLHENLRDALDPDEHTTGAPRVRRLFPETLLWAPEIVVDETGETKYGFTLADNITTWHLSAIANDKSGNVATAETAVVAKTGFFIDLGLPVELTRGDTLSIPAVAYNYSGAQQSVTFTLEPAEWFTLEGAASKSLTLAAGQVGSAGFTVTALKAGKFKIKVSAKTYSGLSDAVEREVRVAPDGKPIVQVQNGRLSAGSAKLQGSIPGGIIPGSGWASLKIYSSSIGHVADGIDAIFKMPHGCFEQTSSATYPNVLALSYLKQSEQSNPELELMAQGYISLGYQRLVTFESDGGGLSWFGGGEPDVMLTAYGLMEFTDMAKVSFVDQEIISRTVSWLKNQAQPGTGVYALQGGGRTSDADLYANAYIAWALAQAGVKRGEVFNLASHIADGARKTGDARTLATAICAMALLSEGPDSLAAQRNRLAEMAKTDDDGGVFWEGGGYSFTGSAGFTADVETTAVAVLALLDDAKHAETVEKAISWLLSKKSNGGAWGSTQATIAALKALVAAGDLLSYRGKGRLTISSKDADGGIVELYQAEKSAENRAVTHLVDLTGILPENGTFGVEIADTNEKSNLMYQLETGFSVPWGSVKETAEVRPLELDVKYDRSELSVNDSVRVEVTASYKGAGETGMVVIDLPIPPGFEVWSPDFDELVGSRVISSWEKTGRQIIVYLDSLSRDETVVFRYRLKALYPVSATAPPAKIFEYYKPESERMTKPQQITVT